jgi:hypothetical protein
MQNMIWLQATKLQESMLHLSYSVFCLCTKNLKEDKQQNTKSNGVSFNTDKTILSNNSDFFFTNKTEKKTKIIGICMFLDESQCQEPNL